MKLLVCDIEGTLFEPGVRLPGTDLTSTVWQALADALGESATAEEVESHERWARGEYATYVDWMRATIEIHKRHGLSVDTFQRVIAAAEYTAGTVEAFTHLDRDRYVPVLVSGGFKQLAERAQIDLDIQHAFAACDYYFGEDGCLAGYNLLPCDFKGKQDFVALMLKEYNLRESDWVFVGDGRNDAEIAEAAPRALGMNAHEALLPFCESSHHSMIDVVHALNAT